MLPDSETIKIGREKHDCWVVADAPYEEPHAAAMKLDTEISSAAGCARELVDFVLARGRLHQFNLRRRL